MSMARRYRRHLRWKRYEARMEGIPGAVAVFDGAGRAWNRWAVPNAVRFRYAHWRGHIQKGEARRECE